MRFKIFSSNIVIFTMLCTSLYGADSATALTESSSFLQSKPDVKQQIASHTLKKLWSGTLWDVPTQCKCEIGNDEITRCCNLSSTTALLYVYSILGHVPELRLSEKTTIDMENSDKELVKALQDFRTFFYTSSTSPKTVPSLTISFITSELPALRESLTSATAIAVPHNILLFANPQQECKLVKSILAAAHIAEPSYYKTEKTRQERRYFPIKLPKPSNVIVCFSNPRYHSLFAEQTLQVTAEDKMRQYTLACIIATNEERTETLLIPTPEDTNSFYGWQQTKNSTKTIHQMKYAGIYSWDPSKGYCTPTGIFCQPDILYYVAPVPQESPKLTDALITQPPLAKEAQEAQKSYETGIVCQPKEE